jgi:hypothetical protein
MANARNEQLLILISGNTGQAVSFFYTIFATNIANKQQVDNITTTWHHSRPTPYHTKKKSTRYYPSLVDKKDIKIVPFQT